MATRRFVVIGLGSFGAAVAQQLHLAGCRVTGLDSSRRNIETYKDSLYEAVIGDARSAEVIEQLGVGTADGVVVSLGEDLTASMLAVLHCRENKARHVIVKGVSDEHGRLLRMMGVERVVFPEKEFAAHLGKQLAYPNVLDLIPLDDDYSLVEMAVPESLVGKSLGQAELKRKLGVWVMGVKETLAGQMHLLPHTDFVLKGDQILLALGRSEQLDRLRKMQ
ncbi:MAG: TrkA family potassium uptake protein [Planctomycetales bacterium]|nr:TrkA family potassium uptake protein [Planctomycetales bacterium]